MVEQLEDMNLMAPLTLLVANPDALSVVHNSATGSDFAARLIRRLLKSGLVQGILSIVSDRLVGHSRYAQTEAIRRRIQSLDGLQQAVPPALI